MATKLFGRRISSVRKEKGSTAVEAALVLPILVIFFIGVVDVGRMLHSYLVITQIARETVRFAAGISQLEIGDFVVNATTPVDPIATPNQALVYGRANLLLNLENMPLTSGTVQVNLKYEDVVPSINVPGVGPDEVSVGISGSYSGFFPLFDGISLSVVEIGPYLY